MQSPSGIQLVISIMNGVMGILFLYCLVSIPSEIIRRSRRKKQGLAVSPILLILRKLLKNWFVAAVIIIPTAMVLMLMAGRKAGLEPADIYVQLVTKGFLGNIGTSLLVGYALMKANRVRWSKSGMNADESKNSGHVA